MPSSNTSPVIVIRSCDVVSKKSTFLHLCIQLQSRYTVKSSAYSTQVTTKRRKLEYGFWRPRLSRLFIRIIRSGNSEKEQRKVEWSTSRRRRDQRRRQLKPYLPRRNTSMRYRRQAQWCCKAINCFLRHPIRLRVDSTQQNVVAFLLDILLLYCAIPPKRK